MNVFQFIFTHLLIVSENYTDIISLYRTKALLSLKQSSRLRMTTLRVYNIQFLQQISFYYVKMVFCSFILLHSFFLCVLFDDAHFTPLYWYRHGFNSFILAFMRLPCNFIMDFDSLLLTTHIAFCVTRHKIRIWWFIFIAPKK